jgi:hypothetical protein
MANETKVAGKAEREARAAVKKPSKPALFKRIIAESILTLSIGGLVLMGASAYAKAETEKPAVVGVGAGQAVPVKKQKMDMFEAARQGDLEAFKALANESNINKMKNGRTALMFAARNGNTDIVNYILTEFKGVVEVNVKSKESSKIDGPYKHTAFIIACVDIPYNRTELDPAEVAQRVKDIIDPLLAAGANKDAVNVSGDNTLTILYKRIEKVKSGEFKPPEGVSEEQLIKKFQAVINLLINEYGMARNN